MRHYTTLILLILLIPLTSAFQQYPANEEITLFMTCKVGDQVPDSPTYSVNINDIRGNRLLENGTPTAVGDGRFNYTFTFPYAGQYEVQSTCYSGSMSGTNVDIVDATVDGQDVNRGITERSIIFIAILALASLIYTAGFKFLGSFFIFIMGFATLFEWGWFGWIIIGIGFSLNIETLLTPPKQKFKYRR